MSVPVGWYMWVEYYYIKVGPPSIVSCYSSHTHIYKVTSDWFKFVHLCRLAVRSSISHCGIRMKSHLLD